MANFFARALSQSPLQTSQPLSANRDQLAQAPAPGRHGLQNQHPALPYGAVAPVDPRQAASLRNDAGSKEGRRSRDNLFSNSAAVQSAAFGERVMRGGFEAITAAPAAVPIPESLRPARKPTGPSSAQSSSLSSSGDSSASLPGISGPPSLAGLMATTVMLKQPGVFEIPVQQHVPGTIRELEFHTVEEMTGQRASLTRLRKQARIYSESLDTSEALQQEIRTGFGPRRSGKVISDMEKELSGFAEQADRTIAKIDGLLVLQRIPLRDQKAVDLFQVLGDGDNIDMIVSELRDMAPFKLQAGMNNLAHLEHQMRLNRQQVAHLEQSFPYTQKQSEFDQLDEDHQALHAQATEQYWNNEAIRKTLPADEELPAETALALTPEMEQQRLMTRYEGLSLMVDQISAGIDEAMKQQNPPVGGEAKALGVVKANIRKLSGDLSDLETARAKKLVEDVVAGRSTMPPKLNPRQALGMETMFGNYRTWSISTGRENMVLETKIQANRARQAESVAAMERQIENQLQGGRPVSAQAKQELNRLTAEFQQLGAEQKRVLAIISDLDAKAGLCKKAFMDALEDRVTAYVAAGMETIPAPDLPEITPTSRLHMVARYDEELSALKSGKDASVARAVKDLDHQISLGNVATPYTQSIDQFIEKQKSDYSLQAEWLNKKRQLVA